MLVNGLSYWTVCVKCVRVCRVLCRVTRCFFDNKMHSFLNFVLLLINFLLTTRTPTPWWSDFLNHSYDYRLHLTQLSPITITYNDNDNKSTLFMVRSPREDHSTDTKETYT